MGFKHSVHIWANTYFIRVDIKIHELPTVTNFCIYDLMSWLITRIKCHILLIILVITVHTPVLAVLIIILIDFTEGHIKLSVSAAVSGQF